MRFRKDDLHRRVKGDLTLEFNEPGLTSYSGLELIRRFLRQIRFSERVRKHLRNHDPVGDYSSITIMKLLLAMFFIGASRLRHSRHLVGDPVVSRFAGLKRFPSERTLSRWLGRCNYRVRTALQDLGAELIALSLQPLKLRRLTLDVDGTVLSTGLQVGGAFRGYNPHHRKVPSYYPITACLAQTGHILRIKNRSGNVHDGKAALPFLRKLFRQVRDFDRRAILEIRLDGAFFRREIIAWLESRAEYAIRVPFWRWTGLRTLAGNRQRWRRIARGIGAFESNLWIDAWQRELRVIIYRKRVYHQTSKNYQLDLFDPDDGTWEYYAIATNKEIGLKALWNFMAGRGVHEKTIGELKTGYAFDSIPTQNFAANSTWQILSTLAHNLAIDFQLSLGAPKRLRTQKRTALFNLKSIRTLRYELINKAGILKRPNGKAILRLSPNPAIQSTVTHLLQRLAKAA